MPSDHAQFMAYALVMTLLTLYYRVKMRDIIWKYFIGFVVLVLALVVSVGRFVKIHHNAKTTLQTNIITTEFMLEFIQRCRYTQGS